MELPKLMLRLVPLLVVAPLISSCGITGLGMSNKEAELEAKRRDLEARMSSKGKVVYAIIDIPEGTLIPEESLEEKEIEMSKIPQDALTSTSLTRGCYAKYGISQGQIVSQYDLSPQANNKIVLILDSKSMSKLTALAGGIPNNRSQVALMLLKNQRDMIETVNSNSYYENEDQ